MSEQNKVEVSHMGRYADNLQSLLEKLGAVKLLRAAYEDDYQGYVDVDVLLADGRVFSYEYSYGSCSGCDEWEDRGLTDEQVEETMLQEATIFANWHDYSLFINKAKLKQVLGVE